MSEPRESEVVGKFREHLSLKGPTEDVKVVYRVSGGMPHERVERQFELTGEGEATVTVEDALAGIPRQEASGDLDPSETGALLDQLGMGLDGLVPRGQARFLPDSVVGTITIEVDGEVATLYFLPDEDARQAQDKDIAPAMSTAIQQIEEISKRLLE